MKIGIYIETAKEPQPRGVGVHVLNLVRELASIDSQSEYFLYYQQPIASRTLPLPHLPVQQNLSYRPIRFPHKWIGDRPRLWWDVWLARRIRRDRLDVFHSPNHFLPVLSRIKSVVTIHDIAYFKMDHLYSPGLTRALRAWTKKSLDRADRVIALSRNTATDLENVGVDPSRIAVIYGGGNIVPDNQIQWNRADEVRRRYGIPKDFILYLGTLHPRKNVGFLIHAFAELKRTTQLPHKLVVVGLRNTATADLLRTISELGLESDVIITGYVEDWEVPLFYKMADLFVLPTLYEGFTLVTLEAMHYGVPVISTDTSSIREGVGDAGVLVPVNDVPALMHAIAKILQNRSFREELVRRGKRQCQKFSWHECARQTLELYGEVANDNCRN
jgi:glycosyltransferase involved in cell wall biosynthesis